MSKSNVVSIDKLVSAMEITLEDYANGVDKCLQIASEEAGKSAEDELHQTSPVRKKNGGEYRKSWTYSEKAIKRGKAYRTELVVYNKDHYRLTHLLEKSHHIANKYGSYGKSTPQPHIEPAQKNAEAEFVKTFERELGRIRV